MKKWKNLLSIFLPLAFGISIVLISAFRVAQFQVQAQTDDSAETVQPEEAAEQMAKGLTGQVDYYLPYPGILPDHPLYWLKMIRDRIMLALTRKPTERLGRLLLYADKRIGAAAVLVEGGKVELGVATATKAEKYFSQVVAQFKNLRAENKATPEMAAQLTKAAAKHEEVLAEILEKVPDQSRPVVEKTKGETQQYYQWLDEIRLGKE